MQRDIDDKRVQEQIVKYLTPTSGQTNPIFFPPLVVAILIRKEGDNPLADRYPKLKTKDSGPIRSYDNTDEVWYESWFYGSAFGVKIPLSDEDVNVEATDLFHGAELSWNRDMVDLLVIDGQHRLVALQAALGILEEDEVVRGYQNSRLSSEQLKELGFSSIPVSIIFPPQLYESNSEVPANRTLVSVFRQVFVDVNKNAKPVSESRNILLNERDLIAVFTRNVIDTFVTEKDLDSQDLVPNDKIPLYAFEWDSPEQKEWQINDSRAVSSVGLLYRIIGNLVFYREDVEYFRTEMGIEEGDPDIDPNQAKQIGPDTTTITPLNFASWQRPVLEERFRRKWEMAIILLLRGLFPGRRLIEVLEKKRLELTRLRREQPLNPMPRLSLDYLLGTKGDHLQIEMVATRYDNPVGRFDPVSCGMVIQNIKNEFLNEEVEGQIKAGNFARLFFSNLGQTQLFEFVFRTLHQNVRSSRDIGVIEIAEAIVVDFNQAFDDSKTSERLFDPIQDWAAAIQTLGTQAYRQKNVSGLLKVSLSFFPTECTLSRLFNSTDEWIEFRKGLYSQGMDDIRESLKSRLPNQVRYYPEVIEIVDVSARRKRIDELVEATATKILNSLNQFIKEHSDNPQELPGKIK
jgi:hypothetical protein